MGAHDDEITRRALRLIENRIHRNAASQVLFHRDAGFPQFLGKRMQSVFCLLAPGFTLCRRLDGEIRRVITRLQDMEEFYGCLGLSGKHGGVVYCFK